MLLWLIYIFLLIFILGYLYQYSQTRNLYNVKTGKPLPGVSLLLNFRLPFMKTILPIFLHELAKDFTEPMYYLFLGPEVKVSVIDHKLAAIVMNDNETFAKGSNVFKNNKIFNRFVGTDNVVFVNGDEWNRQRRSINPAFFKMEKFVPPFLEKAKLLLEKVDSKGGVVENIGDYMQKLTLDILGKTIFDYEFQSIEGSIQKVLHAYEFLMTEGLNIKSFIFGNLYYNYLPNSEFIKKFESNLGVLEGLIKDLIEKSKKKIQQGPSDNWSMLEYLVQANMAEDESKMSDEELRQNVIIFFLAGHETTSVSLSFGITLLSKHKDIQEKMRKEIQAVIKEHGAITYDAMNKLDYTLCYIKEVMRMYPPVNALPDKYTTKDTVLGDIFIPKNSNVTVNIHEIHYSKDVYGDPENFRPDRWTKEEQLKRKIPNSAWIPFSAGSRVCVGNNFSLLEQKILYSELLLKYELISLEDIPIDYDKIWGISPPKPQKIHFKKLN